LAIQQNQIRENEQVRREFTANVSHELKTPLQTISGCAELLANGVVKPEDVPRFSKEIYDQSQRMIQLVEDIIKLSHLDEGAGALERTDTDLYALAQQTVESLRSVAQAAQVTLTLTGGSAGLKGVDQLLSGIVYNLCDNAIKYNRPGGTVVVRVQDGPETVKLQVADTGIGIPLEYQERIFERFFRVDKSHSRAIGGTGLGLSIVKHAARLHNASIDLESQEDKGTTVTVTFPKY
jgi:two-component system phosphate regulon sensor histidine kinase PhoR